MEIFHDQIILDGFDPLTLYAIWTGLIDGLPGIDKAAQLNDALVGLDTDLEGLEKIILGQQRFDLGRDDRIVHVFPVLDCLEVDAQATKAAINMMRTNSPIILRLVFIAIYSFF
jgi:hypothetical protein